MPTYVWKCNKCETKVEVFNKIKDYKKPPEEKCECGQSEFTKVIVGASFSLKGDGWHDTDYNSFERRIDKK